MIPFFELRGIGNYCLASGIGAAVKAITNDKAFFSRRSKDGYERMGRWVNEEATLIFSKDRHNIVGPMDIISFKYDDNSELINRMSALGRVGPEDWRRHGKLDMYSVNIAELIIKSMTGMLDYSISHDRIIVLDFCDIPVAPIHNDIAMKYLFKKKKELKLFTRTKIIPSLHAVENNPISKAADLKEDINTEHRLLKAYEAEDGVSRRYAGRNVIDMFPEVGRKWIRLYFKVCKSTLDAREKMFKEGIDDIEKWADTVMKEYEV